MRKTHFVRFLSGLLKEWCCDSVIKKSDIDVSFGVDILYVYAFVCLKRISAVLEHCEEGVRKDRSIDVSIEPVPVFDIVSRDYPIPRVRYTDCALERCLLSLLLNKVEVSIRIDLDTQTKKNATHAEIRCQRAGPHAEGCPIEWCIGVRLR